MILEFEIEPNLLEMKNLDYGIVARANELKVHPGAIHIG